MFDLFDCLLAGRGDLLPDDAALVVQLGDNAVDVSV
jgi:hypothetical protein